MVDSIAVGYSDLLTGMRAWVTRLAMPSVVGGLVGLGLRGGIGILMLAALGFMGFRNIHPHERPQELGRPLRECRRRRDRQATIAIGLASAAWLLTRV